MESESVGRTGVHFDFNGVAGFPYVQFLGPFPKGTLIKKLVLAVYSVTTYDINNSPGSFYFYSGLMTAPPRLPGGLSTTIDPFLSSDPLFGYSRGSNGPMLVLPVPGCSVVYEPVAVESRTFTSGGMLELPCYKRVTDRHWLGLGAVMAGGPACGASVFVEVEPSSNQN